MLAKSEWVKISWRKYLCGGVGIRDFVSPNFSRPLGSALWNCMVKACRLVSKGLF